MAAGLTSSVKSNGGQGRVIIDPEPRRIARELKRLGGGLDRELKGLHRKLADTPLREVERRARRLGSGFVRIARATKAASQAKGVVLRAGGGRFPDFAGWEFGAYGGYRRVSSPVFGRGAGSHHKRTTRQFRTWRGNDEGAGYVIHPIMRDEPFMERFGIEYVDALEQFLEPVFRDE